MAPARSTPPSFRRGPDFTVLTGTLDFTAGDNDFTGRIGGTPTATAAFSAGSDTFDAGAQLYVANLDLDGADVTLSANTSYRGDLTISAGELDLGSYLLSLRGPADFDGGTIADENGKLYAGGTVTLAADTTLSDTAFYVTAAMNASADLDLNGSSLLVNSGTYDFLTDASIDTTGSSMVRNNPAGVIEKTAGSGTSTIEGPLTNDGTIRVSSGTLDLAGDRSRARARSTFRAARWRPAPRCRASRASTSSTAPAR